MMHPAWRFTMSVRRLIIVLETSGAI
uniref:Uncharacterized protein n=1 Tax=Arundo donax TaxID=35708 RepID=A0A0A9C8U9_ARUDO